MKLDLQNYIFYKKEKAKYFIFESSTSKDQDDGDDFLLMNMDQISQAELMISDALVNIKLTLEPRMNFDHPNLWLSAWENNIGLEVILGYIPILEMDHTSSTTARA